jgi:hypothetical protein
MTSWLYQLSRNGPFGASLEVVDDDEDWVELYLQLPYIFMVWCIISTNVTFYMIFTQNTFRIKHCFVYKICILLRRTTFIPYIFQCSEYLSKYRAVMLSPHCDTCSSSCLVCNKYRAVMLSPHCDIRSSSCLVCNKYRVVMLSPHCDICISSCLVCNKYRAVMLSPHCDIRGSSCLVCKKLTLTLLHYAK